MPIEIKTPKIEHKKKALKKYKEELIANTGMDISFKELPILNKLKDKINDTFNKHFDQHTFEKLQKAEKEKRYNLSLELKQNSGTKSRFDEKKSSKNKKMIGLFAEFALKLGYDSNARDIHKKLLRGISIFNIFLSLFILGAVLVNGKSFDVLLTFLIIIWTALFIAIYLVVALVAFLYIDIKMYQNVRQIEESLPDFLQLASANISAGMTIDRALWFAVRSKFGVLATEMETVAKSTIAGEELEKALTKLGKKYDSRILKETINLIVEGIQSGGEMAMLLNKLSTNIKETQLMKKEIGASVMTYAIFIGVATVVASPALFALSTQLLTIIQQIFGSLDMGQTSGASAFSFNFSGESIKISDFKKFSILVLLISSFFSAAIISVIQKGSVKDGIKMIPLFAIISVLLYYGASKIFSAMMSGLF